MLDLIPEPAIAALIGAGGGLLLGLAARLGRFCTLGAIEDMMYAESTMRLRMWGVAMAVAVFGTFAAVGLGGLTLSSTIYMAGWNPIAVILGGLLFGYGMAMAGNCGFGALARLGGGDLRSFVIVLVMGLVAYATLSGPLAPLRMALFPPLLDGSGGIATAVHEILGVGIPTAGFAVGAAILATTLFGSEAGAERRAMVLWGSVVGLAIVSGWIGTQWLSTVGFDELPVVSHSFTAQSGAAMLWLMTATGTTLSFAVGSVAGVLLGALIGSLIKGHFRWEACEDPRELTRQIGGAAMMGVGAVLSLGCSVGQGLSAFSVLSFSAPLAIAAIFIGATLGLRHLIAGFSRA